MKKYSLFLILLLLLFSSFYVLAEDREGMISGIQVNSVAVATQSRQFTVPVENGHFVLSDLTETASLFVSIPEGAGIESPAWALSQTGDNAWITLAAGEPIPTLQISRGKGSLSLLVFQDDNYNGIRGKYEVAVDGVLVELLDASGSVLQSGEAKRQELVFSDLPEGEYTLRLDTQDRYFFTKLGEGIAANQSVVDATEGSVARSLPIPVRAGKRTEVGAGVAIASSMEGRVWLDENNDGLMSQSELGFQNIELFAKSKSTGRTYPAVIDEKGYWKISQLPIDNYSLQANLPEDYLFAIYTMEGRELRSVFTPYTEHSASRDYVIKNAQKLSDINIGVIKPASVEIFAFFDQNHDALPDEEETGQAGVVVEVIRENNKKVVAKGITNEEGRISIPALRENQYRIRALLPQDGTEFSETGLGLMSEVNLFPNLAGRRESSIGPITLKNKEENKILIGLARQLNFGGRVYLDSNSNGRYDAGERLVPNISVRAVDAQGEEVYRTKTDAKGNYRIPNLYVGDVKLEFAAVKDHMYVRRIAGQDLSENHIVQIQGGVGITDSISLVMGEDNVSIDAGLILSGSISGRIFEDLNDNGREDDKQGFAGVEVHLLDEQENVLLSTHSDEGGNYLLEGILPGRYQLLYKLPEENMIWALQDANGNTFTSDTAEYRSDFLDFLTGSKVEMPLGGAIRLAELYGTAFLDTNGNGLQDAGENVLHGFQVELKSANPQMEEQVQTIQADGSYRFIGLRPGSYSLSANLPEGYIFSNNAYNFPAKQEGSASLMQASMLRSPSVDLPIVKPASLETFVWLDENLDGIKSAEDAPYAGVGFVLEYEGTYLGKVNADENGQLALNNLRPGKYRLGLVLENGAKAVQGYQQAPLQGGMSIVKDFTLQAGEKLEDKGFGVVVLLRFAGRTWTEVAGEIQPRSGIEIQLYNQDGKQSTTYSDENGYYFFENLNPGEYYIQSQNHVHAIFVEPGDPAFVQKGNSTESIAGEGATSQKYILKMPVSQEDVNIISIVPATIGDYVWLDDNQNGLQDEGEAFLANISLHLYRNGELKYSTKSNGDGFYYFGEVYPGEYTLQVELPDNMQATQHVEYLPEINSDLIKTEGNLAYSAPFSIESGEKKYNIDLGLSWIDASKAESSSLNSPSKQDWSEQLNQQNKGWAR